MTGKPKNAHAFCLIRYVGVGYSEEEVVWNSQDIYVPTTILGRSGRDMVWVDWLTARPEPDYEPAVGSRVFVPHSRPDVRQAVRAEALAYVDRFWDGGVSFPLCQIWNTRLEAAEVRFRLMLNSSLPFLATVDGPLAEALRAEREARRHAER